MREGTKDKSINNQKLNQPLLRIKKQNIIVYNDRIEIYNIQPKINSINNLQTNPTLTQIPSTFKQIKFNQTDIVFKFNQKDQNISFSKIYTYQKPFLQLYIDNKQERKIFHNILKKKWCEAGFQDQYEKLQQIGKGAMAKVFLISRKNDGKKFAAKIISLKTQCQKTYDTFINQTKILRVLNSPYVVALQGVYISQKKELIQVLEYLNGGTLFTELKQDLLKSSQDKLRAIKHITLGLQHLRQRRILHRDLKLENIMIRNLQNGQKQYVITDFGLSNWIGDRKILFEKCGTPGYLAPQILHEKKGVCLMTHSTDIFSLGILYHYIFMHSGLFSYNGCAKKLLQQNKKGNFSLNLAALQLHKKQFILLEKTLDMDPQNRPTSRQLLDKYIPQLQLYIQKQIKQLERENKLISIPTIKLPQQQKIEQRVPSYRKKNISVTEVKMRSKTQMVEQKSKNSSRVFIQSARKALKDVVGKISTSFSKQKKVQLKPKNKQRGRQQMRSYLE